MNDTPATPNTSYVDTYVPPSTEPALSQSSTAPAATAPAVESTPSVAASPVSQALEDQNIFFLLGVEDGTNEEKESFLDELQQVIWEDFLENDVELLITEEEMVDLKKIMARKELSQLEQQEQIVVFLEKLVPDLEEIMLEKALELKEDMVRERMAGMKEYFEGQTSQLEKISQAETLLADDQWRAAAELLNTIK